jgi:hypothetical protein
MAKFQQKFEQTESNQPQTPEEYLWVCVLSKAAHDAIYTSDWLEARKAIAWFKSKSKDFREVCELAGLNHEYVYWRMLKPISNRENHMEYVKTGNRFYVKDNIGLPRGGKVYHSHYRTGVKRGPYKKKKHLTGNAYYKAKRKKDPYYVKMGKLGGRPRMYNGI